MVALFLKRWLVQMSRIVLFNKPYGVICQFSPDGKHPTLKDFIPVPGIYPAGRLDTDSEGLLILTDDGALQHRLAHPVHKLSKTYWVQVEGIPDSSELQTLQSGVNLGDFVTLPAQVRTIVEPANLWARMPPIRQRKNILTSWIELILKQGKNRQVRRMTAKIGCPTLRLIRSQIGNFTIENMVPGEYREVAAKEFSTLI